MADCESELLIESLKAIVGLAGYREGSAEHGIGLMKKQFLPYSKSEPEIALMKALKHTMDPQGILNPGRVF